MKAPAGIRVSCVGFEIQGFWVSGSSVRVLGFSAELSGPGGGTPETRTLNPKPLNPKPQPLNPIPLNPSSDRPRTLGRGPYSPSTHAKNETKR